jgi:hypothetical protein
MYIYTIAVFYISKIPGNRFANGILFGVAEASSMFVSQIMLARMHDITVFNLFGVNGLIAAVILAAGSGEGIYIYFVTFCLICTAGGWFNVLLLIIEMRIPPKVLSQQLLLLITFATGSAVGASPIAMMADPIPPVVMIILMCISLSVA